MHDTPAQPEPVPASLSSLPDEARSRALTRFQTIRPFLEDGVPLTQIAREQGLVLRPARRWVNRYRKEGLTGLARKERGDKDKRKLTPALQQLIEGMALRKPRMPVATIHREVTETAKKLGQEPPSYKVVHAVIAKLEPALVTLAHRPETGLVTRPASPRSRKATSQRRTVEGSTPRKSATSWVEYPSATRSTASRRRYSNSFAEPGVLIRESLRRASLSVHDFPDDP